MNKGQQIVEIVLDYMAQDATVYRLVAMYQKVAKAGHFLQVAAQGFRQCQCLVQQRK